MHPRIANGAVRDRGRDMVILWFVSLYIGILNVYVDVDAVVAVTAVGGLVLARSDL